MNSLVTAGRYVGALAIEHAPTVLTISAIGGVGATAVLSWRSAVRIKDIKIELDYTSEQKPTRKEYVKASWKELVPPVLMGAATIACIIGAHRIHMQRQAAIAAAYSILNDKYAEYRSEVTKELGDKKERKIVDKLAQEKINKTYGAGPTNIYQTRFGDVLFMDDWTGRFFYSSYEAVEKAKLALTAKAQSQIFVSLNQFYELLEIPTTTCGRHVGWNVCDIQEEYNEYTIPIDTSSTCQTPTEDRLPCTLITYEIEPVINYDHNI